ncbi:MFS transporter [Candidatus Bipolaricaulota bacterium]|nr:MFS transporter [Candidatus Bipolaricaulota bacterium]
MRITETAIGTIAKAIGFLRRQPRDWKITVVRSSTAIFFYQLIFPYLSIYTIALGATATQLGIVNSAGMAIAGLVGPLIGWLIDRTGVKRIYLTGIFLLAISYLTYGLAQSWAIVIIAMTAYWLGNAGAGHSCSVICGNSLANEDRATGMSLCETFASGLLGIAAPMLGALLVATFGGVNVSGIRPLFFLCLAGTIATFLLILTQLSNRRWESPGDAGLNFFKGIGEVFKQGRNLKRWLVISSIGSLPMGMLLPFTQPFAHEVKGADQYVLGAMVTGFALVPLLFGIPAGRLADRIGRKKVLYLTIPLVWISSLILIWAPSSGFLVLAGILQGFYFVSGVIAGAMTFELVPPEQMGRWLGVSRFCRLLLAAGGAYLSGIIWDNVGPQYVFLTVIGLDLFIRIPLLIGMPETLDLRKSAGGK